MQQGNPYVLVQEAEVSILIRSPDRMQPNVPFGNTPISDVSILIRSPDRMQRGRAASRMPLGRRFNPHPVAGPDATWTTRTRTRPWCSFQSSSGRRTGCNGRPIPGTRRRPGFNPHPVAGPDATRGGDTSWAIRPRVSILIRSPDRMQLEDDPGFDLDLVFQSSSGRRTGCNQR